jgi:large subunit ribosomal protein L6
VFSTENATDRPHRHPARDPRQHGEGRYEGFERKLELVRVGYRAAMQGKDLILSLGFSHPCCLQARKASPSPPRPRPKSGLRARQRSASVMFAAKIPRRVSVRPEPVQGLGREGYAGEVSHP